MYHFFRGRAPFTTRIIPQLFPKVAGQVNFFPSNAGIDGAHLDVWWVKKSTGERIGSHPWASFDIGPDGNFGPFYAFYGIHFEFAVTREGDVDVNFYYEPFVRSDNLVRLNIYTTDVDAFFAVYETQAARLGAAGVAPPGTLLGVGRLAFPELMVELEGTAVA